MMLVGRLCFAGPLLLFCVWFLWTATSLSRADRRNGVNGDRLEAHEAIRRLSWASVFGSGLFVASCFWPSTWKDQWILNALLLLACWLASRLFAEARRAELRDGILMRDGYEGGV